MTSLEEKALLVEQKLVEIEAKCKEIKVIANMVTNVTTIENEQFAFSQEDKKKLIAFYLSRRAQLVALVNELPEA